MVLVLAGTLLLTPSAGADGWATTYGVEGEAFVGLGGARAGARAMQLPPGSMAIRMSEMPDGELLAVQGWTRTCATRPTVEVYVDGALVVSHRAPSPFTIPVWHAIDGGPHWIGVRHVDGGEPGCTVLLDRVESFSSEAINTATPGSRCMGSDGGYPMTPPPAGTTANPLPDAPAYHERSGPSTGAAGTMVIVHGGGWMTHGPPAVASVRDEAAYWNDQGWETLSVTYAACDESLDDVLWFHDRVRAERDGRVCVLGESAGAHLALMTAATRDDVDCVIARGAITDIPSLPSQEAHDFGTGGTQSVGTMQLHSVAVAAWGDAATSTANPMSHAAALADTPIVLSTATTDPFVPLAQATSLRDAVTGADPSATVVVHELPPGGERFAHASATEAAWTALRADELRIANGG